MADTELATVIAHLKAARERVARPNGWCQGRYEDPENGAYCAAGALLANWTTEEIAQRGGVFSAEVAFLSSIERAEKATSVPRWNDSKDRTQAQVVAAFDRCIAELEQKAAAETSRE